MFTNKKNSNLAAIDTLIGENSIVEGKVVSSSSLRIEGQIKGDVECEGDVLLGQNAIAHSNITARNIYNSGSVHGSITSNGSFTITNTGKMFGNIAAASLSIAEGGIFHGTSLMDTSAEQPVDTSAEVSDIKPHLRSVEKNKAASK